MAVSGCDSGWQPRLSRVGQVQLAPTGEFVRHPHVSLGCYPAVTKAASRLGVPVALASDVVNKAREWPCREQIMTDGLG